MYCLATDNAPIVSCNTSDEETFKSDMKQTSNTVDRQTTIPNEKLAELEPITNRIKRIKPIQISNTTPRRANDLEKTWNSDVLVKLPQNGSITNAPDAAKKVFSSLINVSQEVDSSKKMKSMIRRLMEKYQNVPPHLVSSKKFLKKINDMVHVIENQPHLLYVNLKSLLLKLDCLKNGTHTREVQEEMLNSSSTGSKKKKLKIQKLIATLDMLNKMIAKSEESEVDLYDDHSLFVKVKHYRKRALIIYKKLCEITGENQSPQRFSKKPIKFRGTKYIEFNEKLEKSVNSKASFPHLLDVTAYLNHCNRKYNYHLKKEDCERVAQEAFTKIGSLLQHRREADLNEMIEYFTKDQSDPAEKDFLLNQKLVQNQYNCKKRLDKILKQYTLIEDDYNSEDIADTDNDESSDDEPLPSLDFEPINRIKLEPSTPETTTQNLLVPLEITSGSYNSEHFIEAVIENSTEQSSDVIALDDCVIVDNDNFFKDHHGENDPASDTGTHTYLLNIDSVPIIIDSSDDEK